MFGQLCAGWLEREGPITRRLLIRLYAEGCPVLHRPGKTVRGLLDRALYSMQKAGEIITEDVLRDRSLESQVLRLVGTPGRIKIYVCRLDCYSRPASTIDPQPFMKL